MFGSWYTPPIIDRAYDRIDEDVFDNRMRHVSVLERLLTDDGYLIVKLWFHLPKKEQKRRAKRNRNRTNRCCSRPTFMTTAKTTRASPRLPSGPSA